MVNRNMEQVLSPYAEGKRQRTVKANLTHTHMHAHTTHMEALQCKSAISGDNPPPWILYGNRPLLFSCNYPLIWTLMSSLLSTALTCAHTCIEYITYTQLLTHAHTHRYYVHHYTHCIALHRQKPEDCVKLFKTLLASLRQTELSQTKQLSLRSTVCGIQSWII